MARLARSKPATLSRRPIAAARIKAPSGESADVLVAADESPLAWLRTRRDASGRPLISDAQYLAGERLRADYTVGHLGQRVTAAWDSFPTSGSHGGSAGLLPTERALAAKERLFVALDAVGPELAGILMEVCCLAAGLEQAERRLALPPRSGKAVLAIALTRLARHYGYLQPRVLNRRSGLLHWGAEGYRPAIPPESAT